MRILFLFISLMAIFIQCSSQNITETILLPGQMGDTTLYGGNGIGENLHVITDARGNRWDVSTAVTQYGMQADAFEIGAGPNAIPSVDFPHYLSPGDSAYPNFADFLVIGVQRGNESRAYPLGMMARREVVNDVFPDAHLSVAY